jgi:cobalt/nickel transport system permease protein
MRHDFLDRYSRLQSPVHRAGSGLKASIALLIVAVTVLVPRQELWATVPVAAILLALLTASRIPPVFVAVRLAMLEPLALGVAVAAYFQPDGPAIVLAIIVKSTLCLLTMILLANTTPFSELLALLRRLRAPRLLVTILALMYRYLFLLVDEAERLNRARASRTFARTRWQRWTDTASLVGRLFVRSTERAERIYAAMTARGWE